MYVIKSNRKTNSYTVKKINRITQVVRVGRRGLKGDPATNLVQSVNGKQGIVVLNATDVGADPTGSSAQALQDAKDYTDSEVSILDSSLTTVAKTGSYDDLSDKPTIPSIAGLATEAQVQDVQDNLDAHEADIANPHSVTKAQVGLGNVDNTSDANKPVSTAQQTALNAKATKIDISQTSVPYRTNAGSGEPNTSLSVSSGTAIGTLALRTPTGALSAANATEAYNLVRKDQMDAADALKVNNAGGTMTGELTNTASTTVAYRQTRGGSSYGFGVGSDSTFTVFGYSPINATVLRAFPSGISLGSATNPNLLYGTGFPNGVVSAPVGSIYIDTNVTNGASSWIKKSGTGNTGWQVLEGDTGIRDITASFSTVLEVVNPNDYGVYVQRKNGVVFYWIKAQLASGWTDGKNISIPFGLRGPTNSAKPAFVAEALQTAGVGRMQIQSSYIMTFVSATVTTAGTRYYASFEISARPDEPWPTTLPGTPA